MMNKPLCYQLVDVQRYYTSRAEVVKAVDGITLDIQSGSFITILGPSGSGKTTLLNLLAGLDRPTAGQIFFRNQDLCQMSGAQLCEFQRYQVGLRLIFQFYNMHPAFTALENVEYPMMIVNAPPKDRRQRAFQLLTQFGLAQKGDNFPAELSGGEKQRVGIARALVNAPNVIIADEPTGDLDSESARQVIDLLLDINRTSQKTIIMVTHDESMVSSPMKVLKLVDGKLDSSKV